MIASIFAWMGQLIPAFDPAEGPPPRSLLAFFRWSLRGSGLVLFL